MMLDATLGEAFWEKTPPSFIGNEGSENLLPYDTEFVAFLNTYTTFAIYFMLGVSICFDIACWKWRKISIVFLYFECIQIIIESLVPNAVLPSVLAVVARFTVAIVFFGVESRSSIASVTFGAFCTQVVTR